MPEAEACLAEIETYIAAETSATQASRDAEAHS
jgi:hypothetical protein